MKFTNRKLTNSIYDSNGNCLNYYKETDILTTNRKEDPSDLFPSLSDN